MIKSMCFILTPSEQTLFNTEQTSIPSIALGVLSGFLAEKGLEIGLYDLNKNIQDKKPLEEKKELLKVVYEKEIVHSYIMGQENLMIDNLLNWMLKDVDFEKYDCVGCSIGGDFSLMQVHLGFLISSYAKRKYNKQVMIGGNNITYLYLFKDIYRSLWEIALTNFDLIIKGAGERAIWDIICSINNGEKIENLLDNDGIVRIVDGEIVANKEYTPLLVRPNWDSLDIDFYKRNLKEDEKENCTFIYKWPDWVSEKVYKYNGDKNDSVKNLVIPYFFNYNCPYNCAFCTQSDYDKGKVIKADVDKTIEDLIYLKEKYNTKYFYFLNNAFNSYGQFADELCRKIIEKDLQIYWSDCARVNNMTYEKLKLMKDAGCKKLVFGFESGSEKILNLVNKNLDLNKTEQVIKWCYELGTWPEIEVIVGLPYEGKEEFLDTYNFINKNSKYINHFWLNEFFVVPNSLIGQFPEKYGVELIKNNYTYENLLLLNYRDFLKDECELTKNARIFGFNEINGRNYDEISKNNKEKIKKINELQNKEFSMVHRFYSMVSNK